MTREQQTSKNYFQINRGLNTEFSEIGFQDGFTTDEANYELLIDGSRRRRKGLAAETGAGAAHTVPTLGSGFMNQTYVWENVGGNPDKKLMVFRTGDWLFFADADETVSDGWYSGTSKAIDMTAYRSDAATDALVQKGSVSFSQGRGHLFVSGQYILPFYVEYDSATDTVDAQSITVRIRDYTTIDDGLSVNTEPTDATIPADHKYNLRNRGWPQDRIDQYKTDQSKWPSRNAIWYKGYKRVANEATAASVEQDGTMTWDSAKLDAEAFGSSSAPVGSIFLNVDDTTTGYGNEDPGSIIEITNHTFDGVDTHTLTIASHGLTPSDTVVISGNRFKYTSFAEGTYLDYWGTLGGVQTVVTAPTANTITITKSLYAYDSAFTNLTLGNADTSGETLARSTGTDHGDSFKAIEFHAGRVFYAGMKNTEFNDYVFFSQIADEDEKFGDCYQEADPTDPNFNSLTSADGGYMIIPGMGGVLNMLSTRNALIIFAKSGVWEITGSRGGVFTADTYQVRKLTDNGAIAPDGAVRLEDSLAFVGPGGIYAIIPNQYTGLLEVQSMSEFTIQTLWNQIPDAEQQRVQMVYDNALKRLWIMYGPNGTSFAIDTMLIFDTRLGAWFKYTFDTPTNNVLMTGFALPNVDDASNNAKMKFIYEVSTTTVQVADFDQTSFDDWDGTNGPLPYFYTGWDNIGDFQSRRQAPVITVYQQRTETGFTEASGVYTAVNPSSTLMSGFWDWTSDATNEATTNKITSTQEVYRHVRAFAPSATTDLDGYPVVVTRNKLRGRGRVLQLKFEGATDKDSHILGFTINYKVSRRK